MLACSFEMSAYFFCSNAVWKRGSIGRVYKIVSHSSKRVAKHHSSSIRFFLLHFNSAVSDSFPNAIDAHALRIIKKTATDEDSFMLVKTPL